MESPERVLIIILAVTLTLFLLITITALIKFIQILNHLKKITEKAEKLADTAESVGEFFRDSAGPLAFAKLLAHISQAVFSRRKMRKVKSDGS